MIVQFAVFVLWAITLLYAVQIDDVVIPLLVLMIVMTAWYLENVTGSWE